jgi:hypothetical protein
MLAATCNRSSSPTTPTTPITVEPTLVSIRISGDPSIPPGESRQFAAIAMLNNGTSRDVTKDAIWRTSNASVFTVAAGLVTASTVGESFLTATYQSRNAGMSVVSIPNGTGILTGSVREANFPIPAARIEVVGGSFAGQATTSDGSGFYRLYGVVGDLQIRTSIADYVPQALPVNVAPLASPRRDQVLNFDLTPSSRILSLAGNYRVTLKASGTCGANIPADAAVRNYFATVTQDGSRLTVVLSGAEFGTIAPGVVGNRFDGRARSDSAEFVFGSLGDYYYYYYSWGIVERLASLSAGPWGVVQGLYVTVVGKGAGPATPGMISVALNGNLAVYDAPSGFNLNRRRLSACRAPDHQLVLTRQ